MFIASYSFRRFGMVLTGLWTVLASCLWAGTLNPALADEPEEEPAAIRRLLFSSVEGGRSTYVSSGFKWGAFDALDRSGLIIMGQTGAGSNGPPASPLRLEDKPSGSASLLAGYQSLIGWGALTFALGPEIDMRETAQTGKISRINGLRFHGEAWLHPTEDTLLVATLIGGSARPHIWGRVALGYQILPNLYAGPETVAYSERDYVELRAGAHLTGTVFNKIEGRISAGWRKDNDREQGLYWSVTLHTRH